MPCQDHFADGYELKECREKLDEVTRMLCSLCKSSECQLGHALLFASVPGLQDWWEKHKELDRKEEEQKKRDREERKLRKAALAKLSKEERKLLGI